jgi:2-(1,2-epoxy-1,2-dihydrophenyl)acetyl-CoA isomerase
MRAAQTLAVQREVAPNVRDLRLPAISVGSPTLYPSSLRRGGRFCAVIVSEQIAPHNRAPELSRSARVKLCYWDSKGWDASRMKRACEYREVRSSQATMNYENIQLEMRDAVGLITLNRPDSLNALNTEVGLEFQKAVGEVQGRGARAVVLTGAGRAFCAGGDLREMQKIAQREGKVEAFFDEPLRLLNECILLIRRAPLPFIAAVNGAASGGGCNLALACDFVIAGEGAKFNQAFIKIGLVPDCGGTFILPRLIGWKRASELMMTGDLVTAARALEMGMINAVVPDDELLARALAMADKLAQAPTAAIGRIKELLEASATNDYGGQLELERKAQIQSGLTKDFKEGVAAFLEKRPPRFVGG